MLRCAVYSDSRRDADETVAATRVLLSEVGVRAEVEPFTNLNRLYQSSKNNSYDLLIMDTSASGTGNTAGIDFVRRMRGEGNTSDVIFISEDEGAAAKAYSAYPTSYITRPITRRKLRPPLIYIVGKRGAEPSLLLHPREGGRVSVRASDIMYIEVFHTELDVHRRDGVLICTGSLSSVLESIPGRLFYRAHRSFAVNLSQVVGFEPHEFIMANGERVTIAKNRYAEAKRALREFGAGEMPRGDEE